MPYSFGKAAVIGLSGEQRVAKLARYGQDYGPFYGLGHMQLTWAGNYKDYGAYRKLPNHAGPYSDGRTTTTSTHPLSRRGALIRWHPRFDPAIIVNDLNHGA